MSRLCQEPLHFSERSTSHDAPNASGKVEFLHTCDLVAGHFCVDCGYAVCEHHRWARHEAHRVTP